MNRNIKALLVVSILFGLSFGIYDFVFPFYLKAQGISFSKMGLIFSVSTAGMFVLRIYLGDLSDRIGRKLFYGVALVFCAIANALTPFNGTVAAQTLFKSLRDASVLTRETMHSVLVYEEGRDRFTRFIGKTRGSEFLFQGGGTMLAGVLVAAFSLNSALIFSGFLLLIAFFLFAFIYNERPLPAFAGDPPRNRMRDLYSFDMDYNLKVISIAGFIFSIGLTCSHCFIMPLFFSQKFGVSESAVAVVLTVHRLALAAPMLFAGYIPRRYFKEAYIIFLVYQGVSTAASALIPNFYLSAAVWLTHDLVGAGVWVPIQSTLVQEYSRESTRGRDVSKTYAYSALGGIFGPYLAGYLSTIDISLPFLASGLIVMPSALILMKLSLARKTPDAVAAEVEAARAEGKPGTGGELSLLADGRSPVDAACEGEACGHLQGQVNRQQ
ncbi:MAG: MFS transporter [Armatimonadetes bacterium]|nr:MFS transporter [Armatimonadota bacterium]